MSIEMDHSDIQELLPQYAAHSFNETVHQQIEAHLASCASCQADLANWRQIIDTLRDELAEVPPDTAQEHSWSLLRARLTPLQQHIHEPERMSASANAEPFLNQPEKSPSAAVTRGPAHQRRLGFVSVIAAAFIILASLALFGTWRRMNSSGTSSATRTVVAPPVSTATTNASAATATPSAGSTPTSGVNTATFVCTGGNSGVTWTFSPCPPVHGQSGTLTITAPKYPNTGTNIIVNFGNCTQGSVCTVDDSPAADFKTDGSGTETISFTVAADVQVGGPPVTGEIQLAGGPTVSINTQGSVA